MKVRESEQWYFCMCRHQLAYVCYQNIFWNTGWILLKLAESNHWTNIYTWLAFGANIVQDGCRNHTIIQNTKMPVIQSILQIFSSILEWTKRVNYKNCASHDVNLQLLHFWSQSSWTLPPQPIQIVPKIKGYNSVSFTDNNVSVTARTFSVTFWDTTENCK